jgi:hypothetical protein
MATVQAAKTAMAWARESEERGRAAAATRHSPGLLIVIGQPSGGPVIEQRLAGARTILELGAYGPVPVPDETDEVPARVR